MNRRDLFKLTAAGAGVALARSDHVFAAPRNAAPASVRPFVETRDHTRVFYKEWGTGRPVLFVHGWCLSSDFWQYQMIHLAGQGFRCIAYDRRGHGRSMDPGRGYDYDTLADDLAAVIEQLRIREVTLVGHSMGSGEVIRYLSRHGSARVSRIVLIAPTTPLLVKTGDNDGIEKKAFDQMRAAWTRDFPKALAESARPFFVKETSQQMIEWGIRLMLQCSFKAMVDCTHTFTETDFRSELMKIRVPALVIHGDADVSAPIDLTGRRTAALVPGSRFKLYEGAPHGLPITHMDRLNDDLQQFAGT